MFTREMTLLTFSRAFCRCATVVLTIVLAGLLATSAAVADPPARPEPQLDQLPVNLQKYVPETAAWAASPWMTSESCKAKGGDFSIWTANVIKDSADLQDFFSFTFDIDEFKQVRRDLYDDLAIRVTPTVPPGRCVDDLTRWSGGPKPEMKPFGFGWGLSNGSSYYCTWRQDPYHDNSAMYLNRWVGAERAMCDGFYVECAGATETERPSCDEWDAFANEYISRINTLRDQLNGWISSHHLAVGQGKVERKIDIPSPGEILGNVALGWFQDLTKAIAEGAASLLAEAMTFWTTADRSSMLQSPAIGDIQGLLQWVGLVVLIGSVMWQGIVLM